METNRAIDVTSLDSEHRRALEEVIGVPLHSDQRLIIRVTGVDAEKRDKDAPQSLDDWAKVYEGLSDEEIEEIDRVIKTRANLTRYLP
jgi:hypothetical protein